MKQKRLPRYLLIGLIALSIFSFTFVNLHAAYSNHTAAQQQPLKSAQTVLAQEDEDQNEKLTVPDFTIIGRVIDLAQRITAPRH